MSEHILFLTGRLAEKNLHRVLEAMQPAPFRHSVLTLSLQVAGLMTSDMIQRRLADASGVDRVMVPGRCRGDLEALSSHFGVPFVRGPDDLKDLPRYFGREAAPIDLTRHDVRIFAEIVDAPNMTLAEIVDQANVFRNAGADVIDLGCLPETPFPHLEEAIAALHAAGFQVSVDSMDPQELLRGGRANADFLLSLKLETVWIADEVASTPVLIPSTPSNLESLYRAIEIMEKTGRDYLADPIIEPIHFGFTESLVRYRDLRGKFPQVKILMGTGNLTELTEADTLGIQALLMGIVSELRITNILTTQVSAHACGVIREADQARRVMYAAREAGDLPQGFGETLLALHALDPFPWSASEIASTAAEIKDPSFRVQISPDGLHVYNRDGLRTATDPFQLFPHLGLEHDGSHAFYLGVELARAQIAWQLGKRYVQDRELDWGVAQMRESTGADAQFIAMPMTEKIEGRVMIFETIVTTNDEAGRDHIAPMGIRHEGEFIVLSPFRPSATLEHVLREKCAVVNYTDDVRIFAGCLTGRYDWPTLPVDHLSCRRLAAALAHSEVRLERMQDDPTRPRLYCRELAHVAHGAFRGFNRAQSAVIEAAILVSRLNMLPQEKIDTEMAYLAIGVEKTAGPRELEAWGWLKARIEEFRGSRKESAA